MVRLIESDFFLGIVFSSFLEVITFHAHNWKGTDDKI